MEYTPHLVICPPNQVHHLSSNLERNRHIVLVFSSRTLQKAFLRNQQCFLNDNLSHASNLIKVTQNRVSFFSDLTYVRSSTLKWFREQEEKDIGLANSHGMQNRALVTQHFHMKRIPPQRFQSYIFCNHSSFVSVFFKPKNIINHCQSTARRRSV